MMISKKISSNNILLLILLFFLFFSCSENKEPTHIEEDTLPTISGTTPATKDQIFSLLSPTQSGINFSNPLQGSDDFNIFTYEYAYNGSGVAIGDIDNDGLPDIYFAGNFMADALYRNLGNLTFEDISLESGVSSQGYSSGVSMADVNGDGWLDIYVCRTSTLPEQFRQNKLFINNQNGTFTEKAQEYKVASIAFSSQAYFLDYDLDGDLDMYLVNHRYDFKKAQHVNLERDPKTNQLVLAKSKIHPLVTDRLFRNEKGQTFTDVTKSSGLENNAYGLSAAIMDVNNDGYPDIYVANDYVDKDHFYINQKNGTFKDELSSYFRHSSRNAMGSDVADFNNDGLLDLMVLDMLPEDNHRQKMLKGPDPYDKFQSIANAGGHYQVMRNTLQINNGNGSFSEIGEMEGISHTDWSWAPLFADFDNDGYKDLFITNGYRRDVTNQEVANFKMQQLIGAAGGIDKIPSKELEALFPSTKVPNYLYRNNGNLSFQNLTKEWGTDQPSFSTGAAFADLDLDGDLDLVVNNIDAPAFIYRNEVNTKIKNKYLTVRLKGNGLNSAGVGAKVNLYLDDGSSQMQVQNSGRGYLSTSTNLLHFGIAEGKNIRSLVVEWPNGHQETLSNLTANTTLEVNQKNARQVKNKSVIPTPHFKEISTQLNIKYRHSENEFNDFKGQPLLPNMLSREGPSIGVADVNGDKLEDFYIGGAAGSGGALFLQNQNSQFDLKEIKDLKSDASYEDTGVLFFDVEGDGDQDLYIVSGGNAFDKNATNYQDRLYLNDGKGNFSKTALPQNNNSGSCVIALDIDGDQDLDLFIGGRVMPGSYPLSPKSILLENVNGQFVDRTKDFLPNNGQLGMVTAAAWQDIDQDNSNELILVGEWMPITILKNRNKQLELFSEIPQSHGSWNALVTYDFDQDGDLDIVAGNRGMNSFYKASVDQPATIYASDFDGNGSIDPIRCYYIQGKSYPKATRDQIIQAIPKLKRKYPNYTKYADATIDDIFSKDQLNKAYKLKAQTFATTLFENIGNSKFKQQALPWSAQVAPVNDFLAKDFTGDGIADLLLIGNDYYPEVETGRFDALNGLCLKGDGQQNFHPLKIAESGFDNSFDGRAIAMLTLKNGKEIVLIANNNGPLLAFEHLTSFRK